MKPELPHIVEIHNELLRQMGEYTNMMKNGRDILMIEYKMAM